MNLDDLTLEELRLVEKSLITVEKKVPAMFCGLNVAQYRAIKAMYTPDERGLLPAMNIISFANGVGKTTLLIFDMIGWTKGPDFLNWRMFPEEAVEYWFGLKRLRDDGLLSLRLVCASDDMKADGSMLMGLKEYFPDAMPSALDNSKCYRQIDVAHPSLPKVRNQIAVKTFDQEVVKHSGSTCQKIWINEPLPANLLGETIGRIRSKADRPSGSIAMFATIIESGWDAELDEDDDKLRVTRSRGHIFENCIGAEVTGEMADEVKRTIGVTLEKADGDGYATNGVLSKSQIETMIAFWQKTCPTELEARKCGSPISGVGKVYVTYNPRVHDVADEMYDEIPDNVPVFMVADPHAARPTLVAWGMVTAMDRLVFFDEWPGVDGYGFYDKITSRRHMVDEECALWDQIEAKWGLKRSRVFRIGDPNRFLDKQMSTGSTIKQLYAERGYDFWTGVNDDMKYRHERVSLALWYDERRYFMNPLDLSSQPHMYFCKRCQNLRRAISNYSMKRARRLDAPISENVDQKFKDGADVVGYAAVWHSMNRFSEIAGTQRGMSDMDRIKMGRVPKRFRNPGYGFGNRDEKIVRERPDIAA